MTIADKIRDALENQFSIDHHAYSTTGSIGITVFPKPGQAVDDLLREADTAMYRAKSGGRNRISFFESAMQAEVEQRLALQQDLKRAVADGQISVHLQPQVDAGGREIGGELLLRWTHPTRGPVSPAEFIPVAEESGLILRLGEMVIRWACVALARLQQAGLALTLSVNVSPRQFRQDNFVDQVRQIVRETGVRADGLIFEVTEGLLIDNVQAASERMSELVELGIRFSIDDFGTGYSSLAYLKRLPLYELKIDRSFVQDTPGDANDTAIVQAILSVARHLKLRVVAEGVETRAQADFLALRDCDCLQGYFFGRPRPLGDWLDQHLQVEPSALG
jgi:EAL domain-containing protein (putative c-di-GMP-specific phosphodiesterase class I)